MKRKQLNSRCKSCLSIITLNVSRLNKHSNQQAEFGKMDNKTLFNYILYTRGTLHIQIYKQVESKKMEKDHFDPLTFNVIIDK